MTKDEFIKVNLGDIVGSHLFNKHTIDSYKIKTPMMVKGFYYWFRGASNIVFQHNNLGVIPNEVKKYGLMIDCIYDKKVNDYFTEPFRQLYIDTSLIPLDIESIKIVTKLTDTIDKNLYINLINNYREKRAQSKLDATNWTGEDLLIECKRLKLV